MWGLLDVGARQTRLILCASGVPVLVRLAGTGGRAWTASIADSLEISVKSAEIHKRESGLSLPGGASAGQHDDRTSHELAGMIGGVLRSNLRELAAEVRRSYEYVLGCYPTRTAADLVLVGGGAALRNLPEFLTESLGIPVRRASTFLGEGTGRFGAWPDQAGPDRGVRAGDGIGGGYLVCRWYGST